MRGWILCGSLLVAWLGCWTAVAAAQQPLYRSSTEAVLVDVQVTADRKPVTGLTAADFALKDMGVEQDVRVVSFADVPISLILVLDASASVIAEETGGTALHVESAGEIAAAFRQSVADFKTRYLLMYTPDGVDVPGWHPIEVSVIGRRAEVTARRGYWR